MCSPTWAFSKALSIWLHLHCLCLGSGCTSLKHCVALPNCHCHGRPSQHQLKRLKRQGENGWGTKDKITMLANISAIPIQFKFPTISSLKHYLFTVQYNFITAFLQSSFHYLIQNRLTSLTDKVWEHCCWVRDEFF
jgi:hypothetical protein